VPTIWSYSVVPKDHNGRLVVHLLNYFLDNHLDVVEFPGVRRVARVMQVACMVHANQVAHEKVEVGASIEVSEDMGRG